MAINGLKEGCLAMDIKSLSADMTPDVMPGAAAISKTKSRKVTGRGASQPQHDRADMSRLSEMMARGAKILKQETEPRAAMVEQFKQRVDEPVDLSDTVVDTIMQRMFGV